jgi:hypothetical protein
MASIFSEALLIFNVVGDMLTPVPSPSPTPTQNPTPAPWPSAPEFTLKLVNSSIEVTIKNQPLTTYKEPNGSYPNLYYGFRFKNHTVEWDWIYAPPYYVGKSSYGPYYKASNSDYTTVSFPLENYDLPNLSTGGQIDFQVIALVGHDYPPTSEHDTVYGFEGVESSWSTKQTFTIPSQTPTALPLTASLAESASALDFGNKINFTVTVQGGNSPYIYAWYMDDQLTENASSPYYSIDTADVGSHHVYVEVTDAAGNVAETLTVEFNILPNPNNTSNPSPSPSVPEFPLFIFVLFLLASVLAGAIVYKKKLRKVQAEQIPVTGQTVNLSKHSKQIRE